MYDDREYVEADGLMFYAVNVADSWRRTAADVDKILKGANSADLPVEQVTRLDLVINITRGARGRGGGHPGHGVAGGEVDFANYVPREHVERLSQAPEISVLRRRDSQRVASYFNLSKRPFCGAQVRRAILSYGMDRQAIVKTALLGLAQPL